MEVLQLDKVSINVGGKNLLNNISFTIQAGEQWAIVGPSGSGKTTLLKALAGLQFYRGQITFGATDSGIETVMVLVDQQHQFRNLSNINSFYYQQRFNSQDADDAITVSEYLHLEQSIHEATDDHLEKLVDLFDIKRIYRKRLIQLSNGENKRVQVINALLKHPAFLLLDNPFIGLDAKSRRDLELVLDQLGRDGLHIILVTSASHLPFFITNVLSLSGDGTYTADAAEPGKWNLEHGQQAVSFAIDQILLRELTRSNSEETFDFAVKMKNVNIRYDQQILHNVNWEVRHGERWSLSGPNGSGKSTLLSLVNADNPQAYANEIYLFDRRRGSGETIWDIKKRTGFVSPELHLYFEKGISCFEVIASGFFDTIGLFRQISALQESIILKWMTLLKIEGLRRKFLHQLSNSEQRLVLLARALVKNPPLLILDEPCQGLDEVQIELFREIVDQICLAGNKTLIYVSHYEHEIPKCVTKRIRLENGIRIQ